MSGIVSGLVMRQPVTKQFTSEVKFTALVYADHAWQDGTHAYPSVATVALETGYAERSVQRYIRILEKIGMLIPDGKGPRGTNKYRFPVEDGPDNSIRLALPSPEKQGGDSLTPPVSEKEGGGDRDSGDRDSGDTGDTQLIKPSLNPTTTAKPEKPELPRYPTSMPEADQNPLIGLFRDVSGVFPGAPYWVNIVDALRLIVKTNQLDDWDALEAFITPYWLAWSTRRGADGKGYNKLNPAWLTEWAVGGQIPPERGQHADKLPTRKQPVAGSSRATNNPPGSAAPTEQSKRVAERINAKRAKVPAG